MKIYRDATQNALRAIRSQKPLVHNITNYVSMDIAANVLLAQGASPAMLHASEEVEDFGQIISALVLNIGTLSPNWVISMRQAQRIANARKIPVVLDPVGTGATPYRTGVATRLLRGGVKAVRGNATEILALAGQALGVTKGADSTDSVEAAKDAAIKLAREYAAVIAVSGDIDFITDGDRQISVGGGHPMMTQITALGCSLTSTVGAFCAVEPDAFLATAGACAFFGVAGSRAATLAKGPGSLRVEFMDLLHTLSPEEVAKEACFQ